EQAIAASNDIQITAQLVADGRSRKRQTQVDRRDLLACRQRDFQQLAAGQHLEELIALYQGWALDWLTECKPPDQPATARIEPQELIMAGIDDQNRGVARNGLGCIRRAQPDGALPERRAGRGVEAVSKAVGKGIDDRLGTGCCRRYVA